MGCSLSAEVLSGDGVKVLSLIDTYDTNQRSYRKKMKSIAITKEVLQRIHAKEMCYPILQSISLILHNKQGEVPDEHLKILGLSEEVLRPIESVADYDPSGMNHNEMERYAKLRSGLLPRAHTLEGGYSNFIWTDYRELRAVEFDDIFIRCNKILSRASDKKDKSLRNNTEYTRIIEYIKNIVYRLEHLADKHHQKIDG